MVWALVVLLWALFIPGLTLWFRSRLRTLQGRGQRPGERDIDKRSQARGIALCVIGVPLAVAVAGLAGFGATGAVLGSIVLAGVFLGIVYLPVRDAEQAQGD